MATTHSKQSNKVIACPLMPYQQGKLAGFMGTGQECPYVYDTKEEIDWKQGYADGVMLWNRTEARR